MEKPGRPANHPRPSVQTQTEDQLTKVKLRGGGSRLSIRKFTPHQREKIAAADHIVKKSQLNDPRLQLTNEASPDTSTRRGVH